MAGKRLRIAAAALAAGLAGCPANFEPQSRVGKLRVLAVRAEPPELVLQPQGPLPKTTLTALAVEPSGAPIALQFALCAQLGFAPSPTLPCPGAAGLALPDAGPGSAELDLGDPRLAAFAAQADGGLPADAGAALDQGVPLLIGFSATAAPGTGPEALDGFATVTLRSAARGPSARNPALTGALAQVLGADGGLTDPVELPPDGSYSAQAGATLRLTPVTAPKSDPAVRFVFSFFATDGSISSLHSADEAPTGELLPTWIDFTAPQRTGRVRLWIVLRDSAGGTAWLERSVLLR